MRTNPIIDLRYPRVSVSDNPSGPGNPVKYVLNPCDRNEVPRTSPVRRSDVSQHASASTDQRPTQQRFISKHPSHVLSLHASSTASRAPPITLYMAVYFPVVIKAPHHPKIPASNEGVIQILSNSYTPQEKALGHRSPLSSKVLKLTSSSSAPAHTVPKPRPTLLETTVHQQQSATIPGSNQALQPRDSGSFNA